MSDSGAADLKARKAEEGEPISNDVDPSYAYDGEETSPMSPGLKRMLKEEKVFISTGDRLTNILAVSLLFAVLITAVISIAAGACCLASLKGKAFQRFALFYALGGVAPVTVGCLALALAVLVLIFIVCCTLGLGRYGMCCYGASKARSCARVCLLGVFPFIVFIVLLAMCILGFTFYSMSRQIPPLDKDYIKVAGISGPVEIIRDENGLTHVKASSRRDAYFGQGFAQAQDRLFQLEFHRTVAKGELSSMVGKDSIKTDRSIRTINVRDAAYAMCKLADPTSLDYFQAFADGVNLYLERVSKRPVEFFFMSSKPLFFHNPEPFSAVDLCLTARLFMWQMSSNINEEGQRFSVWAGTQRNYSQVEELFNNFDDDTHPIMSESQMAEMLVGTGSITGAGGAAPTQAEIDSALAANAQQEDISHSIEAQVYDKLLSVVRSMLIPAKSASSAAEAVLEQPRVLSPHEVVRSNVNRVMTQTFHMEEEDAESSFPYKFLFASNAWAARTADGKTVVASDPHLTINSPAIWYYSHLSFPDENGVQFDVAGVGMVGLSGVHIGKSTYLAWGITMSKTDLIDLFILPPQRFSGLPARTYRYGGVDRVFVSRRERIAVKGQKDIVLDVDDTMLGPVVSDMLGFPASLTVTMRAACLLHDDDTSIDALLSWSDPATNTAEKFMNTLANLQAPGFSIPIGDIYGNIAYGVTGRHPLRNAGHTGKYPTPAFDAVSLASSGALGQSANLTALLPAIAAALSQSNWRSYPAVDSGDSDLRIPKEANPHLHIPFDGTAAHISAANQRVVPKGFPFFLGADYSWSHRGARVQEMLDSNINNLQDIQFHLDLQRDYRSNYWNQTMRDIVSHSDFLSRIADDPAAVAWADRLLYEWDGFAPIGSVETAFFWRWVSSMSVLPRDAIKAAGLAAWNPQNGYLGRMLTAPTSTMLAECADYMGVAETPDSCMDFAAKQFKEMSHKEDMRWGKDLNHLRGIHEMVDKKIISPLFRREMEKAGDRTSVGVSGHAVTGNMLSTQSASARQVFDLWNDTSITYVAIPGGNSGNPYSEYFQNMWNLFEKDLYVTPKVAASAWDDIKVGHKQVLSR